MSPGARCECGHTITTKKDARDEQSMQQLTNRVVKHAVNATYEDVSKNIEAALQGRVVEEKVIITGHRDWIYAEKTKGDKRFDNPDELV